VAGTAPAPVRRLVVLVCAVVLVDTAFFAAITPLLPYFSDRLSLCKSAAGVLTGAYPAGTLLASLPAGWFAARAGVKPAVLVGLALLAGSSLAFGFAEDIVVLDLARFVQGVGGAASWTAAFAWLVGMAPRERRGQLIGTAFSAALAGALMGPVLGAVARSVGPRATFSVVAAVAAGLAAWAWWERAPRAGAGQGSLAAVLRRPATVAGVAVVLLVGLFFGVVDVLVPLRLDHLGAAGGVIGGTFLAAAALEGALGPLVGRTSDRRGPLPLVRGGLVSAVVLALLLPLPASVWVVVALMVAAAGLVGGGLWVPGMALLSQGAEAARAEQGYAFALMNLAWAGAQVLGAAGGGGLADLAGDGAAYAALAAVCAVALAVSARAQPSRFRLSS
jgi:MFS family permease